MKSLLGLRQMLPIDSPEDQLQFLTREWGGLWPLAGDCVLQVEGEFASPGATPLTPSQVQGPQLRFTELRASVPLPTQTPRVPDLERTLAVVWTSPSTERLREVK